MGPRRRSSETADVQIIKQGCLIKSPPSNKFIFNNRASWKGRLLKLCKLSLGSYTLRYYAYDGVSEELKGEINMSEVKSIEIGKSSMDRMATVMRLFNNDPSNFLCIKTGGRDYFLVDESEENIVEWHTCITDAWVKAHQAVTIQGPTSPSANLLKVQEDQEEAARPKSYPQDYPRTETVLVEDLNRQRSLTDSECGKACPPTLDGFRELKLGSDLEKKEVCYTRPHCNTLAICCRIPSAKTGQERRRSAAALLQSEAEERRLSNDLTDPAYDTDPEYDHIYDIPRPTIMKMSESQDSAAEPEESSDMDTEEEEEVYLKMNSFVTDPPPKPPRRTQVREISRYLKSQGSQLKKPQILKMIYEPNSELETVNVTVSTAHLQKYLGLQEAGERLWVSKWKGPVEIGCLFHHGDYIESMNGFRTGNTQLFLQLLSNSVSDEVHLVLRRIKNSPVFHVDGCSCERL